jgi:hypothetical protein
MTDIKAIAGEVMKVDEAVMKLLPFISGVIGFVPGAQVAVPFLPLLGEVLTAVDEAAKAIQAGDPAQALDTVLVEIRNHLTPGAANSAALAPSA